MKIIFEGHFSFTTPPTTLTAMTCKCSYCNTSHECGDQELPDFAFCSTECIRLFLAEPHPNLQPMTKRHLELILLREDPSRAEGHYATSELLRLLPA